MEGSIENCQKDFASQTPDGYSAYKALAKLGDGLIPRERAWRHGQLFGTVGLN